MDDSTVSASISVRSWTQSTPQGTPKRNRRPLFVVPDSPGTRKSKLEARTPVGICDQCGKKYFSKRYFDSHRMSHKLKESAERYPDEQALLDGESLIARETLEKMKKTAVIGKIGVLCHSLLNELLGNLTNKDVLLFIHCLFVKFVSVLITKKFCMPSVLHQSVLSVVDNVSVDVDFRRFLFETISTFTECQVDVFNSFFVEFLFTLGEKTLHFIINRLTGDCDPLLTPEVVISKEERQIIHYVSGAIIRAFFRKCLQFKGNIVWANIKRAITKCILEGDVAVSACDTDKHWTSVMNRGALFFVGKSFMNFIMCVVKLLYHLEKTDGSLLHEEVQEKLLESPAKHLWDNLIGTVLREDESLSLMRGVVRSFTTAYGKGISLKHKNRVMKKPKASISLRKRLGAASANE